jgi:hypothetical protein
MLGLLGLLIEEMSLCMALMINSLYTMDISLIKWQLLWGDLVGVFPDLNNCLNHPSLSFACLT